MREGTRPHYTCHHHFGTKQRPMYRSLPRATYRLYSPNPCLHILRDALPLVLFCTCRTACCSSLQHTCMCCKGVCRSCVYRLYCCTEALAVIECCSWESVQCVCCLYWYPVQLYFMHVLCQLAAPCYMEDALDTPVSRRN